MSLGRPVFRTLLQEVECPSAGNGLRATLHPQFATEVQDVFLDRVDAKYQVGCDLAVGRAIHEQPQHLTLACSEWFQQRAGA